MSGQEIVIEISADGREAKVEGIGFQGNDCLATTKAIEAALGEVAQRKMKPVNSVASQQRRTR